MKEDILEQLIEDWLISQTGWFVKHNVKFRPSPDAEGYESKQDSVHSDIDILAVSGRLRGPERVRVVTCKSWQGGLDPRSAQRVLEGEAKYNEPSTTFQRREDWKGFRELVAPKWLAAFVDKVEEETGQRDFEYYVAVTKLRGGGKAAQYKQELEGSNILRERFQRAGSQMHLRLVTLQEIVDEVLERLKGKPTTAVECTEVGRLLQLFHAASILH